MRLLKIMSSNQNAETTMTSVGFGFGGAFVALVFFLVMLVRLSNADEEHKKYYKIGMVVGLLVILIAFGGAILGIQLKKE
jgi:Na+/melibiose symporter-like transporter